MSDRIGSLKDIEESGRSLEEFYLETIGDNTTKVEGK